MNVLSQHIQSDEPLSRYLLAGVLAILAGLIFYLDAILRVITAVITRSDSSHGVFVPLLSAYFIFTMMDRLKQESVCFSWYGIALMVAALIPALGAIGNFQIQFVGYIGFLNGLVLALMGPMIFKRLAFPLGFLITMTPLPPSWYEQLADLSRTIAFGASLKIISLLGIPHVRVGWDIELPNALLRVAISCSGIRYLISFIVFGLAYAYLFRSKTLGRLLTVLATVPISLLASILRLTIIFVMTYYVSPYWSRHGPHVALSWLVFFSVLTAAVWMDRRAAGRWATRVAKSIREEIKG